MLYRVLALGGSSRLATYLWAIPKARRRLLIRLWLVVSLNAIILEHVY